MKVGCAMQQSILYDMNEWGLLLLVLLLFYAAAECGYRLGRRRTTPVDDSQKSQVTTGQGAMLGLLGLLLGFTFAMALEHYDTRKKMTLDEANVIGTAYLRAQLLPPGSREDVSLLLKEYTDLRLGRLTQDEEDVFQELDIILHRSEEIHDELWAEVIEMSEEDNAPNAIQLAQFTQTLNELIDTHSARRKAALARIPEPVLWILLTIATLCMLLMGYGASLGRRRPFIPTFGVLILVALAILLIFDLDNQTQGLITTDQQDMELVADMLERNMPSR